MIALTAAQIREADRLTTERAGISSLDLMEKAGESVYRAFPLPISGTRPRRVAILCGKGNNGGDGLVAARHFMESKSASEELIVLLFSAPEQLTGDAAFECQRYRESGGPLRIVQSISDWDDRKESILSAHLIVDAMLGTGLRDSAEGLLRRVIEDVNTRPAGSFLIAVDIPSGLPSDGPLRDSAAIRADRTVTFTAPKVGHFVQPNSKYVGELLVRDIGTPRELIPADPAANLFWIEPREFASLPLRRRWDAHKGDFGHAVIVAGSLGKTGAAGLAAMGALRSGAGLVTVATPGSVLPVVAGFMPEMMTEPLASTEAGTISLRALEYGRLDSLLEGKSVLAIGPGISTFPETQQFVRTVVASCPLPLILDADAINAFAGRAGELAHRKSPFLALTPHPGEMARLLGCTSADVQARRLDVAREGAARWNAHIVLKGAGTIVATPDGRAFVNTTGAPAMATGGTGDVLAGIIAGLTAQFGTRNWEKVLAMSVYLHGRAGEMTLLRNSYTMIASDLAANIPSAFSVLVSELNDGPH